MKSVIDEILNKAADEGKFDNLPGMGKPLQLDTPEMRMVPPEYRLAYRILRDNDLQPAWIAEQKEIDTLLHQAQQQFLQEVSVNRQWAERHFRVHLATINKRLLVWNLKVPVMHLTRDLLDPEDEIERLTRRTG